MQRRQFQPNQVAIDAINEKYATDLKATSYYIIKDRNTEKSLRKMIGTATNQDTVTKKEFSESVKKRAELSTAISNSAFGTVPPEQLWSPPSAFTLKGSRSRTVANQSLKVKTIPCMKSLPISKRGSDNDKFVTDKSGTETKNEAVKQMKKVPGKIKTIKRSLPAFQTKNTSAVVKFKKELVSSKPLVKKISSTVCSAIKISPPPVIATEVAQNALTSFQRIEKIKSLRQKGLPPIQPWKPGKIPPYRYTGRLKDLDEMLENAFLEAALGDNNSGAGRPHREVANPKKSNDDMGIQPATGRSSVSVYAPLRGGRKEVYSKKMPRRSWQTWNFKSQWPLPL